MAPPVTITDKELADFRIPGGRPGLSAQEQYELDGYEATQAYLCDWGDRDTVVSQAAASPYPHKSGANAYLYRARIVGIGQSGVASGLVTYEQAVVRLFFSTLAPYYTGGKWVKEEIGEYAEGVPISTEGLYWESGADTETSGDVIDEVTQFQKFICGLSYTVTYYHVASVPGTVLTLLDGCNNAVFNTLTFGLSFPAGTVLYKEGNVRRTIALGGSPDFWVRLVFWYRPADWNKKWRPDASPNGGWRRVYRSSGSQVIFHNPVNLTLY